MHNDDPTWGSYAATCIQNLGEDLRKLNTEKPVFTSSTGGSRIEWVEGRLGGFVLDTPLGSEVWRETESGGARVRLMYYKGFGWLSDAELHLLRQKQPRTAP